MTIFLVPTAGQTLGGTPSAEAVRGLQLWSFVGGQESQAASGAASGSKVEDSTGAGIVTPPVEVETEAEQSGEKARGKQETPPFILCQWYRGS